MNEYDLAGLIYSAHSAGGYGRSFSSVLNKGPWRAAAAAVIHARETGQL